MAGTQNWALGVCDNGDLYANSTSGSMTQKKGNGNFGMLGSVGLSPEISPNAHCAQDLGAGFHLDYAGAIAGPYGANVSWANGKGVDLYSGAVSPWGGPGAGGGAGITSFDTYTNVHSWNWVAHLVNDPLVAQATAIHNAWQWIMND